MVFGWHLVLLASDKYDTYSTIIFMTFFNTIPLRPPKVHTILDN